MKKLLRDLWDKEETIIVLVLAVALVLSALFFCWSGGDQMISPAGNSRGRRFGMIIIGKCLETDCVSKKHASVSLMQVCPRQYSSAPSGFSTAGKSDDPTDSLLLLPAHTLVRI